MKARRLDTKHAASAAIAEYYNSVTAELAEAEAVEEEDFFCWCLVCPDFFHGWCHAPYGECQ